MTLNLNFQNVALTNLREIPESWFGKKGEGNKVDGWFVIEDEEGEGKALCVHWVKAAGETREWPFIYHTGEGNVSCFHLKN